MPPIIGAASLFHHFGAGAGADEQGQQARYDHRHCHPLGTYAQYRMGGRGAE